MTNIGKTSECENLNDSNQPKTKCRPIFFSNTAPLYPNMHHVMRWFHKDGACCLDRMQSSHGSGVILSYQYCATTLAHHYSDEIESCESVVTSNKGHRGIKCASSSQKPACLAPAPSAKLGHLYPISIGGCKVGVLRSM